MTPVLTARTTHLALPVLSAGLLLGLLGDRLFYDAEPGINLLIWVAALAAAAHYASYRRGGALNGTDPWLLVAISFASLQAVRDAESLRVFNILAVALALGLAGLAQRVEPRLGQLRDYAATLFRTAIQTATGVLWLVGVDTDWSAIRGSRTASKSGRVLAGLVLAIPIVLVFGSLFAAADPAFNALAQSLFGLNIARLVTHVIAVGFFAWVAAGLLRAWLWPPQVAAEPAKGPQQFIGPVPIQIALGSMVLVFAVFTAIQARWLLGGEAAIRMTTGLTYAELARQGFFEMVAACALAIPLLYGAEVLHDGAPAGAVRWLRRLGAVQLVLVLLTMLSALARVRMYTEAYGLSIIRLNGSAVIVWLGAVITWFGMTVLRGRRERFTFGAVTSGFAVLGMLNIANPEAQIVRVNTERAVRGATLDAAYLAALSADAAPLLVARLRVLPIPDACVIGTALRKRWLDTEQRQDWRSWNLSVERARAAAGTINLPALGCGS